MQKPIAVRSMLAACMAATLLLAGCGGGGSGGASAPVTPPSVRFGASTQFEGICTVETQKRFVRSYLDEVYLWYDEIPEVDATRFGNVADYFNALLVRTPDANGVPKDRFSAVLTTSGANAALSQSFTQGAAVTELLASHTDAVPLTQVVMTPAGRRTGYILFNDHETGAQDDLITAFRQLRDGAVQDLVLDLRNNSGGFLYIAQAAASMVVGPSAEGKLFEQLRYNDKRGAETAVSGLNFSSRVQFAEGQYPVGTQLPQLGLSRVYILTTGLTCSASESIINSLRGIDVQVVLVGTTTCGKPYGFRRKDNCGLAYFPIEFQGTNAKGAGGYTSGFTPTCTVQANPAAVTGGPNDRLLNTALFHIDNGFCPAAAAASLQSSALPQLDTAQAARPAWAGRLLTPP
jgi:hypothetical protein